MKRLLFLSAALALLTGPASAIALRQAEHGTIAPREVQARQDICYLAYYNFCSGWAFFWQGYCRGEFADHLPTSYGVCFDLVDCPGECRHLTDVWWASKHYVVYGVVDIEVMCADSQCCPTTVLGGIYGYTPWAGSPWNHFIFQDLPLCPCDPTSTFAVVITNWAESFPLFPYSDLNALNVAAGCETEWRCEGHSFVFKNAVDYCAVYGMPGPLWISGPNYGCTNYPQIPPGCHTYLYPTGYFSEWLCDVYISCLGASQTEKAGWSEIKRLYR